LNASAQTQFNRVARAYMASPVHAQGPDLAWLAAALEPQPTWKLLDAGTGAGHAALTVAAFVAGVTAVDVAEHMLRAAAELAFERGVTNLDIVQASVESLPFVDCSYDAACTRYSAHHWSHPATAIAEIARVLKPGSPVVLSDTVGFEDAAVDTYLNALELLRDPSHVCNATVATWSRLLAVAGFAVTSVKRWNVSLETTAWLARSATAGWRMIAARQLLLDAPQPARNALGIADDGESFTLPCAMITARRHR
jgi:ubiquinone/menaquinone biosynthesis C-methylase UbiE